MILAKVVGVASTLTAGVTAAAVVSPIVPPHVPGPVLYDILGVQVPILPVTIGVLTAALVRVVVMTSSPRKLISYNVAVTLLAMLGSAAFITDHQAGPGMAFWVGGGFGAVGVGIVQMMKSRIVQSIVDGIRAGLSKGLNEDPTIDP